jgi:hypothetical protein
VTIVADTLDNANFNAWAANWTEEGDVGAGDFKWIHDEEPGLNHWAATAYKVATVQTLDPLPAGNYTFSLEVQRGPAFTEQYLFARGCKTGELTDMQTQTTAAATAAGYTTITLAFEVSFGKCTVGVYSDSAGGGDGWANMDNAVFAAAP